MNIYDEVIKQKIEHSSHSSDLYIPVNDETKKLVSQYEHKGNVTIFSSAIDGKPWFDIPFAYEPFWPNAEKQIDKWCENKS